MIIYGKSYYIQDASGNGFLPVILRRFKKSTRIKKTPFGWVDNQTGIAYNVDR